MDQIRIVATRSRAGQEAATCADSFDDAALGIEFFGKHAIADGDGSTFAKTFLAGGNHLSATISAENLDGGIRSDGVHPNSRLIRKYFRDGAHWLERIERGFLRGFPLGLALGIATELLVVEKIVRPSSELRRHQPETALRAASAAAVAH